MTPNSEPPLVVAMIDCSGSMQGSAGDLSAHFIKIVEPLADCAIGFANGVTKGVPEENLLKKLQDRSIDRRDTKMFGAFGLAVGAIKAAKRRVATIVVVTDGDVMDWLRVGKELQEIIAAGVKNSKGESVLVRTIAVLVGSSASLQAATAVAELGTLFPIKIETGVRGSLAAAGELLLQTIREIREAGACVVRHPGVRRMPWDAETEEVVVPWDAPFVLVPPGGDLPGADVSAGSADADAFLGSVRKAYVASAANGRPISPEAAKALRCLAEALGRPAAEAGTSLVGQIKRELPARGAGVNAEALLEILGAKSLELFGNVDRFMAAFHQKPTSARSQNRLAQGSRSVNATCAAALAFLKHFKAFLAAEGPLRSEEGDELACSYTLATWTTSLAELLDHLASAAPEGDLDRLELTEELAGMILVACAPPGHGARLVVYGTDPWAIAVEELVSQAFSLEALLEARRTKVELLVSGNRSARVNTLISLGGPLRGAKFDGWRVVRDVITAFLIRGTRAALPFDYLALKAAALLHIAAGEAPAEWLRAIGAALARDIAEEVAGGDAKQTFAALMAGVAGGNVLPAAAEAPTPLKVFAALAAASSSAGALTPALLEQFALFCAWKLVERTFGTDNGGVAARKKASSEATGFACNDDDVRNASLDALLREEASAADCAPSCASPGLLAGVEDVVCEVKNIGNYFGVVGCFSGVGSPGLWLLAHCAERPAELVAPGALVAGRVEGRARLIGERIGALKAEKAEAEACGLAVAALLGGEAAAALPGTERAARVVMEAIAAAVARGDANAVAAVGRALGALHSVPVNVLANLQAALLGCADALLGCAAKKRAVGAALNAVRGKHSWTKHDEEISKFYSSNGLEFVIPRAKLVEPHWVGDMAAYTALVVAVASAFGGQAAFTTLAPGGAADLTEAAETLLRTLANTEHLASVLNCIHEGSLRALDGRDFTRSTKRYRAAHREDCSKLMTVAEIVNRVASD